MQAQKAAESIREGLAGISELYHRLVLVVGPAASGKTTALRIFASAGQRQIANVGLELARLLLDLTERQRILQLPGLLEEIVTNPGSDSAVLDNTEALFASPLRQDPLRLLMGLSRNRTIIASWLGTWDGQSLTYAVPDHPEYRKYSPDGLIVIPL
jgi:energy-coupling factor transporter ATP-binding protein EcfA2